MVFEREVKILDRPEVFREKVADRKVMVKIVHVHKVVVKIRYVKKVV